MRNTILARVCIAAAIVWGASSLNAQADDDVYPQAPSVTLGPWACDLKAGPRVDAAGRNLRDSEFVHQDLRGAIFDRCDLSTVTFRECNLSGASFKSAEFNSASIMSCDLTGADFDDASVNGLWTEGRHLSERQLRSTRSFRTKDLTNCTIGGSGLLDPAIPRLKYDFRSVNLSNAHLLSADFRECDFSDANIGGITIDRARITFAQIASTQTYRFNRKLLNLSFSAFGSAGLPGGDPIIDGRVDFRGLDLTGIKIGGQALPGVDLTDATITGGAFTGGGITKSQLCSTRNYKEGNLSRMTFHLMSIAFPGLDLAGQNLTGTVFTDTDCTGTKFNDAVITDCNLCYAEGLTLEQIKSTWNYKHGRMAGVVLPKELAEALQKEKASEKKRAKE